MDLLLYYFWFIRHQVENLPIIGEKVATIRWVNLSFDLFQCLVVIFIDQDGWPVINRLEKLRGFFKIIFFSEVG